MKLLTLALMLIALVGGALAEARMSEQDSATSVPKFVFTGKVKALRSSNEPSVKGSDRTVVVTVEEVTPPAPEILAEYKGQDITVRTNKPLTDTPLSVGQKAIFTTQGLVYGKGLVVREVADRKLLDAVAGAAVPEKGLSSAPAAEVVGTVEEVHPVPLEKVITALAKAAPKKKIFPREHDPKWHEAVVQIQSASGEAKGKEHVVIVFPQSDDVAWHRAPKFHKGQKGKFRLHKTQIKNPALRLALLGTPSPESPAEAPVFTALNPDDFTPQP
jgi:hypothetical protein